MSELKIVGWTEFDSDYPTKNLEGENMGLVIGLIKQAVAENGYKFSGSEHQCALTGAPVFSDGTVFRGSMRCWGVIMASVWSEKDGINHSYMDYYMSMGGEETVMPPVTDIPVAPAEVEDEPFGCAIQQDIQILQESAAMGMPMMTTDKVLQDLQRRMNG